MQLCALDDNEKPVFAGRAVKQQNYICLECRQHVRLRSGLHRQAHFYHVQPNHTCRMNGKGMVHLMLQNFLKDSLPSGEAELERRFNEIGRIADVAWPARRLIYEIQCSPITAAEVQARNADYASLGYQVVWIFHDARYNQNRLTAAEDVLRHWPHYFTDMDESGCGHIYEHFALVSRGMRLHRLPRQPIDATAPRSPLTKAEFAHLEQQLPKAVLERARRWQVGFSGDLVDRCLKSDANLAAALEGLAGQDSSDCEGESDFLAQPLWQAIKSYGWRWLVFPYRAVLRLLLERACR